MRSLNNLIARARFALTALTALAVVGTPGAMLAASLLHALKSRGTPPIDAAEYRSLRGLKKGKGE